MSFLYVREKMLPQMPPPGGEQGAVKWLRENLFSSWLNSILTVLAVLAIFWLINASVPWLLHSVWRANSLSECRAIIAASWGEGATGACWAVIRERWHQFIFGFYPPESYWRPVWIFGAMFAALSPVLFNDNLNARRLVLGVAFVLMMMAAILTLPFLSVAQVTMIIVSVAVCGFALVMPKKALWITLLFPATAVWFLWGGSMWSPVMTMVGFAIIPLCYRLLVKFTGAGAAAFIAVVAALFWWFYLQGAVSAPLARAIPIRLAQVDSDQFGGFLLAFSIGVTAIVASLPIGIILALGRKSDMLLIKTLCVGFIEFVRGVPLIAMLFTASLLLQYFLPRGTNFDLILRVDILVTLFASAYIAEVIRGGLAALPRGQYEAADALGLDYWQAQRLIIMPQALKISIPGIVSSFIGLFKDTTLVAFVGLLDPLKGITTIVRADINWKGIYWEPYIFVGAIFFIFCFGMSRYSMYLENKLKRDHR